MSTCGTEEYDRLLFLLRLPPDPSSVGEARRRLNEALEELGRADLVEDTSLVVSELVTNALLHTGGEITVTASYDDCRLLVQVSDHSPHLPRPRRYGGQARTGRGLHLVESLTGDWGFLRHAHGKTVWARWSSGDPDTPDSPESPDSPSPAGQSGAVVGGLRPPAPRSADGVVLVELLDTPVLLHAVWREHAQALLRDYLLASLGELDDDESGAVQVHAAATDAIALLDEHVPRPRASVHSPDLLSPAVEPEITVPALTMRVPRTSVPHFATLDRAVDEALVLAEDGLLLTPPTQPEVATFRRWICRQVRQQAAGRSPEPFRVPLDTRVEVPSPAGWDPGSVTDSDLGLIAADSYSRIIAVSGPAATLLGYDDPLRLVGRRIVAIIPSRLRQAHVAGMTMYVLTDRRPLLDRTVQVPAVRQDGTEIEVEITIAEVPTDDDRPVLVARIEAAPIEAAQVEAPAAP